MTTPSDFHTYPTGKIPKAAFCDCCARYNSRYTTASVILVVDNQIVLVQRAEEPDIGQWDIPGGYLSWEETLEDCAKRELFEETGLQVSDLSLLLIRSDPNWDPLGKQNIDHYYLATAYTGKEQSDAEVSQIKWFPLDALPEKIAFDQRWIIERAQAVLAAGGAGPAVRASIAP